MRALIGADRAALFMRELGAAADAETRVYFTGGITAVLVGWRGSTIDADILIEPESDAILRAIPALKERLSMNVELAAPSHFIPEVPGWRERSLFIVRHGRVSFFHYDPYSQALAKIERGHRRDQDDVAALIERGLVDPAQLGQLFETIEAALYRFPAIDPARFRRAVEDVTG